MSNRPTHGLPLTEEELRVPRNMGGKGWQAGARYVWASHFGSPASNNKPKRPNRVKGRSMGTKAAPPERRVTVPGWARRYTC